jgi:CRISPR-associated endonuclease Cas2
VKKLLKPRDILLLGVGGFLDIFGELKDPLGIMAKSYKAMYGFTPQQYKKRNYSHLIWRTLKTGYIERILKRGEVYLRLTSEGQKKIIRDFPLIAFQKRKWDGKWRLVLFDIAELNRKTRDMLRRKLKELGFGMFQQSAYISPHNFTKDLLEFLNPVELSNYVYVFEIPHRNMAIGDSKELANKLWKLDSINEEYLKLIERIKYLIGINGRGVR